MDKKEVLERLCALSRDVMEKKFDYMRSADCFCGAGGGRDDTQDFRFDPLVVKFIEDAVNAALAKD